MSSHLRRRLTAAGANRSFPRSDLPHTSSRQLLRYTTALNHPAVGQGLRGESVSAPAPAPTPRGSAALVPAARGTAERLQPPVPTAGPVAPPPPQTPVSQGETAGGRRTTPPVPQELAAPSPHLSQGTGTPSRTAAPQPSPPQPRGCLGRGRRPAPAGTGAGAGARAALTCCRRRRRRRSRRCSRSRSPHLTCSGPNGRQGAGAQHAG